MKSKQGNRSKRGSVGIGNTKADEAAREAVGRTTETYVARGNRGSKRVGKGRDEDLSAR